MEKNATCWSNNGYVEKNSDKNIFIWLHIQIDLAFQISKRKQKRYAVIIWEEN